MKRRLVTALVFLLLGAVVTVAVAWGCYAKSADGLHRWTLSPPSAAEMAAWRQLVGLVDPFGDAVRRRGLHADEASLMAGADAWVVVRSSGFPWRSLRSSERTDTASEAIVEVIWSGVVIDTVTYAVLASLPWAWLRAMRRRRRARCGLCPSCTYPIGTSPVCTECGCELPASARRAEG